ncbi:GAP family protein [Mycobacterium sp. pUA109]|uniref:GAP family protein n=1 Tax=Mycobacterium sp. pUA109 TaxID=3238982 RepID=UPI00351BEAE5
MWGTVLVLSLMAATDPIRLGIAVVLVSRPRPLLNLLAFWLGGITTGVTAALGALVLLRHTAPSLMETVSAAAASSTVRHIQIAAGVLALAGAVVIAVGFSARQQARAPAIGAAPPGLALPQASPSAFPGLPARAVQMLEGGAFWLAYLAGIGSATPPVEYLVAIAAILASGAALGTQLSAAVIFTVVTLAVVEIPLVSWLATPAKTQTVMLRLHDWVRSRRRRILSVVVAVAGAMLVATGLASG